MMFINAMALVGACTCSFTCGVDTAPMASVGGDGATGSPGQRLVMVTRVAGASFEASRLAPVFTHGTHNGYLRGDASTASLHVVTTTAAMTGVTMAAPPEAVPSSTDDVASGGTTPAENAYGPPARPLDPRIKAEKITESEPPPLPSEIHLPLAPSHRIASDELDIAMSPLHQQLARRALERGLAYLRRQQGPGGGWMESATAAPTTDPGKPAPVSVAITALALKALAQARADESAPDPAIDRGSMFLVSARGDGGTWDDSGMSCYVHSCVVSALAALNETRFADELREATRILTGLQWDQGEGLSPRQDWFGGAGYGSHGRPDLSNTQFMLDALHDAGISPDEPVVQRALAFVSRAQNFKSANPASWAQNGANDGGFIYTPANGGESMASEAAGEGRYGELVPDPAHRSLRSYGSMTYAGFKSMVYAGLDRNDPRVRAAYDWIRRHFRFDENPGLGQQGLFYYYHAMARALRAAQQPIITPIAEPGAASAVTSAPRNWREALVDALVERQRDDGSWVNSADRWLEGQPALCTTYAVLALEEILKPAPEEAAVARAATGERPVSGD